MNLAPFIKNRFLLCLLLHCCITVFGQQESSEDVFTLKKDLLDTHRMALQNYFQSLDTTSNTVERASIHNKVAIMYYRASYYLKASVYDSVIYHANKVFLLVRKDTSRAAVKEYLSALSLAGSSYRKAGEYSKALQYFMKSMNIINNSPHAPLLYGERQNISTHIALVYEGQGNYSLAIKQYETLLAYVKEQQTAPKKASSIVYIYLGRFYKETGRLDAAVSSIHKGIQAAIEEAIDARVAMGYLELASIHLKLENYEIVKEFLSKAYLILEKEESVVYLLSEYYYMQSVLAERSGDLSGMVSYAEKAFNLLYRERVGKDHVRIGELLSKAYKKTGSHLQALEVLEKTLATERILTNNEEINKGVALEIEKKENAITIERKEKELEQARSKIKNTAIGVILLLFIVSLFFGMYIFRDRRQKLRLTAAIQAKNEELKQLDLAKSHFFANISHELRTPLTLIGSPLEQLLDHSEEKLQPETRGILQLMQRNTGRLKQLVNDILDLTKLESHELVLKEQATEFHTFLNRVSSNFSSLEFKKRNIEYTQSVALPNPAWLLLDTDKVEKILYNLLSNAMKHTTSGDTISLKVAQEAAYLSFSLKDTGSGIGSEDLPHIFDRYFQGKTENTITRGGTGIGLALSRELALLMKGSLEVESELGEGSVFTLQIPYKEAVAPELALVNREQGTGMRDEVLDAVFFPEQELPEKKYTVLIVDDEPDVREFIQGLFKEQFHTRLAIHGKDAINILKKEKIDLIISDMMMPEMNGYQLLEALKGADDYRGIPVIMLTALNAEVNKLQALTLGVDDYLTKPFSPKELLARVSNLLHRYEERKRWQEEEEIQGTANSKETVSAKAAMYTVSKAETDWIHAVADKIKEELENDDFQLNDLAGTFHMSLRQFQRKVKKITGLTPRQYQQEIALQKARELLENNAYANTTAIAYSVGIYNVTRFSRLYEARFGKKTVEYFG